MASHSGKEPKPVHERVWEKLLSGQIPCVSIKSVDEAIHFREDNGKWYFHLTYTAAVHSKSKRMTVEDPDESYVRGTRQRLLASPLILQQGSACSASPASQLYPHHPPQPAVAPPTTIQPSNTPTTLMTSTLCRAAKVI